VLLTEYSRSFKGNNTGTSKLLLQDTVLAHIIMFFWLCSIVSRSCSQKEQERKGNATGPIITKLMYDRWRYQSKTRDDLTAVFLTTKITCQRTYKYALLGILWRAWQSYKASTYSRKITNIGYANVDNRSVSHLMHGCGQRDVFFAPETLQFWTASSLWFPAVPTQITETPPYPQGETWFGARSLHCKHQPLGRPFVFKQ